MDPRIGQMLTGLRIEELHRAMAVARLARVVRLARTPRGIR
jgi:hypothetical protein